MASINGDWFHSRSSSNLSELLVVRSLLLESQKPEYIGLAWSAGREDNPLLYQLADSAGIQPSTMQTKVRAMIRYGFVRDGNMCPLVWTRFGSLWNDLYSIDSINASRAIYQLTLTISLAIFAFNDSQAQFSINPLNGDMPLKFLLNNLDQHYSISVAELVVLVDGNTTRVANNISYWKADLINSGLLREADERLYYSGIFPDIVQEIKSFEPNPAFSEYEWQIIRDDPLVDISPFQEAILATFEEITQLHDIEEIEWEEYLTEPIIDTIIAVESPRIQEIDILSDDERFARYSRRVRNSTWSNCIKEWYRFACAVPECDIVGSPFIEAAHVKPNSAPDGETPHRTHILNGLCLCKNCHSAFEIGLFTLTDDCLFLLSTQVNDMNDHTAKRILKSSNDRRIKERIDERFPLPEFIQYHREHKFQE